MEYNLELDKTVESVADARNVLIQLPDGLKPKALLIKEEIENRTNAKVSVWLGSCFGACDVPKIEGFDLLIQWGHSEWKGNQSEEYELHNDKEEETYKESEQLIPW